MTRGVITLVKKQRNKGNKVKTLGLSNMLNAELKISDKVLAKRLVHVVDGLVEEAQTSAIPGRTIHDNLRLIRYKFKWVGSKSVCGCVLVYSDQVKAFH